MKIAIGGKASRYFLVLLGALSIAISAALPASAQSGLDTGQVPRVAGAKTVYVGPASTIYTTQDSVAVTAANARNMLAAAGWQEYSDPFAQRAKNPTLQIMTFKKGAQALSVFIIVAPAQGNATGVTYTAIALANDLPFPRDASEIAFDPNRPHLNLKTVESLDTTLAFFRKELGAQGWALWSRKEGAKQDGGPDGEATGQGAYAYYVKDNRRPLLLTLQRDDGTIKVELRAVPASALAAERPQAQSKPAPRTAERAESSEDDVSKEFDRLMRNIISEALTSAQPHLKPARPQASRDGGEPLQPLSENRAPIPVPSTAQGVEFDSPSGRLEFNSASSVAAVAAFYRSAMKPLGWKERSTPINRPNMVVLNFARERQNLSFTIMQIGSKTNVRADGSGLVVQAQKRESKIPPPVADAALANDLEAEDMSGLPVPASAGSKQATKTHFRVALEAEVRAPLDQVQNFYRRELGKRDWKEDTKAAAVNPERVTLAFTSPEGPAVLELARKDGKTAVKLSLRKPDEVRKAGVMPKPGQAKIVIGNMNDTGAEVVIAKRTIKLGPKVGSKGPDGPNLDLPPGTYQYSLKIGGRHIENDEVKVGAGELWGLVIAPNGALALHMY